MRLPKIKKYIALFLFVAINIFVSYSAFGGDSHKSSDLFYSFTYGNRSSVAKYYPASIWRDKFPYLRDLVAAWKFDIRGADFSVVKIDYKYTNLPQFALHITNPNNKKLLVYNHGHSGLPSESEIWARDFLQLAYESDYDLLVTSMPTVGLNKPNPSDHYWIEAFGRRGYRAPIDPALFAGWSHYLYETVADPDSYLHYFTDQAVILPAALFNKSGASIPSQFSESLVNFPQKKYESLAYVGLSGGGATGLSVCALVAYDRCILIAGFVPLYIRLQFESSWGDAEQTSRSIYGNFPYEALINLAENMSDRIIYVYNKNDTCCFSEASARLFKSEFTTLDVRITDLSFHGYDPYFIFDLLKD